MIFTATTTSRLLALALAAAPMAGLSALGAHAEDKAGSALSNTAEADMTPEEKAEREARKSCKVAICAAFRNKGPGADVSCNVVKTWRKEQIDKMISKAKVHWPFGRVQCTAVVNLKREELQKASTEAKFEAKLAKHEVKCTVNREKDGPSEIKFDFSPVVTFENGKATKAHLNWGKIDAPTLVKGAMWTATATDNTFNVLQGTMVDDINDFMTKKCDEVKDELAGK
jgi:hypothetical protein